MKSLFSSVRVFFIKHLPYAFYMVPARMLITNHKPKESRGIVPTRILNGPFMGSMNMPGISLSLLNLTNVAEECPFVDTSKLAEFLDAPHNSVAWPATSQVYPLPEKLANRKREDKFVDVEEEKKEEVTGGPQLFGTCLLYWDVLMARLILLGLGNEELIRKAMKQAAEDVLASEPKLTKWDTVSSYLFQNLFVISLNTFLVGRLSVTVTVEKHVPLVPKRPLKLSNKALALTANLSTFSES